MFHLCSIYLSICFFIPFLVLWGLVRSVGLSNPISFTKTDFRFRFTSQIWSFISIVAYDVKYNWCGILLCFASYPYTQEVSQNMQIKLKQIVINPSCLRGVAALIKTKGGNILLSSCSVIF